MLTVYSKETTSFSTLGIGVLKDFLSNPLITEELNGAYTLEFQYAKDGYLSEYLIEQNIIKANGQAFRIWNIKKDMQKITVLAKHIFFDLSFNFLSDVYPKNLTAQGALAWLLNRTAVSTNFSVTGNCTATSSARYVRKNFIDAIFNEDNALVKKFGGELSYDNFNITVHNQRGSNANFSIRYKKNLTGIDFNLDFSNVATRIVPIGFDGITIDSTYVESSRVGNYFTPLYKTYEFSDIKYDPDDEDAYHTLAEAKQALANAANELFTKDVDLPQISISVNFVELSKCTEYSSYSNLETVHLGDTINVIIPELNINTTARVNKTIYDCILERFTKLEIGSAKQSVTRSQINVENQIRKSENYLTQAQQNAENLINHPFNGNVYIDKENGVIYLMDSASPETAQNVWKWSLGGLGFSSTGINGTYTVAILQDGRINADFITTGQLDTGVIQGYDSLLIQVDTLDREFQKEINPTQDTSGTTFHLEDSAETELVNFEMEGKTTQETRSGKNLVDNTATTKTINGLTFTVNNDKTVTVNGTSTANTTFLLSTYSLTAGTYTIKGTSGGGGSTYNMTLAGIVSSYGADRTFTISETKTGNFFIYVANGQTLNNITFYPMVENGSTSTSYEQYGAMPSPDYPSELVSVGYENLFDTTITNQTINGIIFTINQDKSIKVSGTASATAYLTYPTFLLKKGTYKLDAGIYVNTLTRIQLVEDITGRPLIASSQNAKSQVFTISEDKNVFLQFRINSSETIDATFYPLLTKGTQEYSYIPYGKYGIEVTTNGKNLISNTNKVGNVLYFNNATNQDYYIFKAGTYTLSFTSSTTPSIYKRTATTSATSLGTSNPMTITSNEDFNLWLYRSGMAEGEITNIQLEKNTQATTFEEYKGKTYLYTLNQPLRSIGDTKDLLYIKNGMLYVERKIGSRILNGSESWGTIGDNRYWVAFPDKRGLTSAVPCMLKSNYFKATDLAGGTVPIGYITEGYYTIANYNVFFNYNGVNTDLAGFKTWLSTHNTEVQYILASSNTEELGKVEIPSTYKTITYINTIDINEPNMNITYVMDTIISNYVEKHVQGIKMTEDGIESRVETIEEGDYGSKISAVEERITDTEESINIISTNIDTTTGEVREVTTTTGFTFNAEGMTISDNQSSFKAQHKKDGTYYYDGTTIVGKYTKDGSMQKDLILFGVYYYGMDELTDTPMFITQLYTDDDDVECVGHFYNGGD